MERDWTAYVRELCQALPGVTETVSHGAPTFWASKRTFATVALNHHNDGRNAVWLLSTPEVQEMLIAAAPDRYFKPPYVGPRGWIGVLLDVADEEEVREQIEAAHARTVRRKARAVP